LEFGAEESYMCINELVTNGRKWSQLIKVCSICALIDLTRSSEPINLVPRCPIHWPCRCTRLDSNWQHKASFSRDHLHRKPTNSLQPKYAHDQSKIYFIHINLLEAEKYKNSLSPFSNQQNNGNDKLLSEIKIFGCW